MPGDTYELSVHFVGQWLIWGKVNIIHVAGTKIIPVGETTDYRQGNLA